MPQDTRIALFLMGELVLEWMNPLLTVEEMDRLVGWHLGVSF